MTNFNVGGKVTHHGRLYIVRGLSPMGVPKRVVLLEDAETKERLEVGVRELTRTSPSQGRRTVTEQPAE